MLLKGQIVIGLGLTGVETLGRSSRLMACCLLVGVCYLKQKDKVEGVLFNTLIIKFIFDFIPYKVKPSTRE
jgi:hypothetical protein